MKNTSKKIWVSAVAVAVVAALTAQAQEKPIFVEMPAGFSVRDINADGQVVSGISGGGNAYWTAEDGIVPLGGTGASNVAVSADGTRFAGSTDLEGNESAGYWLGGSDWLALGTFPGSPGGCPSLSSVYDMSADGTIVVGLGWDFCDGRAFKWTQATGMIDLGTLVPDRSSRANGISADGRVIVGWNDLASGQRVAAKWVDEVEEFILQGGHEHVGEAYAATPDGSIIVGISCTNGDGWKWTSGGDVECVAGMSSAWNVSADGSIIVGSEGPPSPSMEAVVHIDGVSLNVQDWLVSQSVAGPGGWIRLNAPGSIAADGSVFGGWGQKDQPFPFTRDWLVVLALGSPRLVLGQGATETELDWRKVTGGGRYDLIRGSLGALHSSGGDYSVATESCLLNSSALTDETDADVPPSGEAFWYLVRAEGAGHQGTYDSGGSAQQGSRDAGIAASGVACP